MNILRIICFALFTSTLASPVFPEGLHFALVAKSKDDINFIDAWKGCNAKALQSGDRCELIGSFGSAHPRAQVKAISDIIQSRTYDALAISVTHSKSIANILKSTAMPVISFDSPFDEEDAAISQSYIGVDNLQIGRELGKLARKLRPEGGSICIMTAAHDPNLALRVHGVRQELSSDIQFPAHEKLKGESNWRESERCPWNSIDSTERVISQMKYTFSVIKPDIFLSVGHWPVNNPALYREVIAPFRQEISNKNLSVIAAIGSIQPQMQALLDENIAQGFVSINFRKMGEVSYDTMKNLLKGRDVASVNYIPATIIIAE